MNAERKRQVAARKAERARMRAQRKQLRLMPRERSQRPPFVVLPGTRPGERSGHRASTAHVQAAYPAVAEAGLGARGVYIGRDQHGGSFTYDPWVLYGRGILNDANTIVIGSVGYGKSALSKSYLWRQRVFGRTVEIIDPKGEYLPLVQAMGGVVLALKPGGETRLNPLTRIGGRELREGLLEAIVTAMLDRPLAQGEAVGLSAALGAADRAADGEVCVPDVIEQLRAPDMELRTQMNLSEQQTILELRECCLALQRLSTGPLRGMFDGPTTAGENVWDAPAVALDLSGVRVGSSGGDRAIGITMVCASTFLDAKRTERAQTARTAGQEATKVVRTNDEAWRALPIAGLGEYYQAAFKLSRASGVQHWMVMHRFSDLRAAGDEGSRQQRLAEGLLSDASTTIVYRQHPREAPQTAELLGLSSTEADRITRLDSGEALWRVGGRSFLVYHVVSEMEWDLVRTDSAMVDTRDPVETQAAIDAVGRATEAVLDNGTRGAIA